VTDLAAQIAENQRAFEESVAEDLRQRERFAAQQAELQRIVDQFMAALNEPLFALMRDIRRMP
jgi:hypothetical protein